MTTFSFVGTLRHTALIALVALGLPTGQAQGEPTGMTSYQEQKYCEHIRFYYTTADAFRMGNPNDENNLELSLFSVVPHQNVTGVADSKIREIIHQVLSEPSYQNPSPNKEGLIAEGVCLGVLPQRTPYSAERIDVTTK